MIKIERCGEEKKEGVGIKKEWKNRKSMGNVEERIEKI